MKAKAAQLVESSERDRRHAAREWQREQARRNRPPAPTHHESFHNRPFEKLAEILFAGKKDE